MEMQNMSNMSSSVSTLSTISKTSCMKSMTWYEFLKKYECHQSSQRPTHMSMIFPKTKFYIPKEELDTFMDFYCMHYMDQPVGIVEQSQSILPVIVDIDFKKEVNENESFLIHETKTPTPIFEFEFIEHMVMIYQSVLREIIDIENEKDLSCFVLQKTPYMIKRHQKTYIKHGVHLHFPCIFLSKIIQEKELIPRIKLEFKKHDVFSSQSLLFSIDQFLDKSYCRGQGTPWLLYGGQKDIDMEPYLVTQMINHEGQILDNGEWQAYFKTLEYTLPFYSTQRQHLLNEYSNIGDIDYVLPLVLSILPYNRDKYFRQLKKGIQPLENVFSAQKDSIVNSQIQKFSPFSLFSMNQQQLQNNENNNENDNENNNENNEETNDDMIDELLGVLNENRSKNRNDWMYVGWILFNLYKGSMKGFEKWDTFSQKCTELYDKQSCVYEWSRMKPKNLTLGSLKYLARTDDAHEYNSIMNKYSRLHIEKALKLNGTHYDLACALYDKYECEYICASVRERIWYRYIGHIWTRDEEGISLRTKISNELVHVYEELALNYTQNMCRCNDETEAKTLRQKIKDIMSLVTHLKSAPYKQNIMKEAMEVFYEGKFQSKLDADQFLFAFSNGVLDLRTFEFRNGRPQDYISIHAPIAYNNEYTLDHPDVIKVIEFLEKIFPDKDVRNYFLWLSSDIFMGGNTHKIVQFWSGEGDNGKSVTEKLFEKMLGSYAVKLPTSLLVGKRTQSSQACPELVRAGNGVRIAMLQEPDSKDTINIGILKELSGNDSFFARGLYKEGQEINPMFKLILICNEPPKIPGHDKATRNRIRVIPFESTFVDADKCPTDPDEQLREKKFLKDKEFNSKIPGMVEPFAWLLLHHLKNKKGVIIEEPEKVKLATSNYLLKNDIFKQFFKGRIRTSRNKNVELSPDDLYIAFKEWYMDGFSYDSLPNRNETTEAFVKLIGDLEESDEGGEVWKGVFVSSGKNEKQLSCFD